MNHELLIYLVVGNLIAFSVLGLIKTFGDAFLARVDETMHVSYIYQSPEGGSVVYGDIFVEVDGDINLSKLKRQIIQYQDLNPVGKMVIIGMNRVEGE